MTDPANAAEFQGAAARQRAMSLVLLGLVMGVVVGVDRLAHCSAVIDAIEARKLEYAAQTRTIYSYEAGYTDFEDRLLLDEIPGIDASRGGVYFVGSSNLKWGLATWDLPADERSRIHNLGIGGTNHEMHGQLIRFLVEERGILSAGAERSLFVFAGSYHCTGHRNEEDGFFARLWRRHDIYSYDLQAGIAVVGVHPYVRWLRGEQALVSGFLQAVGGELVRTIAGGAVRVHDPAKYNEARANFMGEDWQDRLATQTEAFLRTALDLKARGAAVSVVLLPQGTWEDNLPFDAAYSAKMKEICAANGIPLVDLGDLLDDEDFADSNHFAPSGQAKFTRRALQVARID